MQIVDLFSGIGGFSLAGHWLGWRTIQFCDINQFGQKVVEYHFPGVPFSTDIKTLTGESIKNNGLYDPNETSLMVGGFPCQPYSMAGKREGTDDARHLWPECIRLVREFRPDFCVWENVPGLINWSGGLVFEQVCADLEGEGYEVQPVVLPASGVNAPHRRDRVWFVAYRNDTRSGDGSRIDGIGTKENEGRDGQPQPESGTDGNDGAVTDTRLQRQEIGQIDTVGIEQLCEERPAQNPNENGRGCDERKEESSIGRFGDIGAGDNERVRTDTKENRNDAYTNEQRCNDRSDNRQERHVQGDKWTTEEDQSKREGWECRIGEISSAFTNTNNIGQPRKEHGQIEPGRSAKESIPTDWTDWPTVAPLCTGNDGVSSRLDGITFPKWRNESIKAGGNAIVPQVALMIFKVIEQMQNA